MADAIAYTATEVAFLLRESLKSVKKALDDGPVKPTIVSRFGRDIRAVGLPDLLYLLIDQSLSEDLTLKGRTQLYEVLKSSTAKKVREVRFGSISVHIGGYEAELQRRSKELAELSDKVEAGAQGEIFLKGTKVEVHRVAALLAGGATVEMVCSDYPSLEARQVEDARVYAEAYPKMGRPFPRKSFKRSLRGACLEALEEPTDV